MVSFDESEVWVTTALEVCRADPRYYHNPFYAGEKVFYLLTPKVLVWIERCLDRVATALPATDPEAMTAYQAARAIAIGLVADVTAKYGEDAVREARKARPERLPEPPELWPDPFDAGEDPAIVKHADGGGRARGGREDGIQRDGRAAPAESGSAAGRRKPGRKDTAEAL